MNRQRIWLILILVFSLCLLSGCFFNIQENKLNTPEVYLSEDSSYITWETVKNAVFYEVTVNGEKYIVRDNVFYFTEGGSNTTITVRAIGEGFVFKNSDAFELNDITVRVKLIIEDFTLRREVDRLLIEWSAAEHAIGYIIDINGTEYELDQEVSQYSYDMGENYNIYVVGIVALAPIEGFYANSERGELSYDYYLPIPASLADGEVTDKDFDKANSSDLTYAIDINDDTIYVLTGNGITANDYSYDGEILTIMNAFLRSLEIGESIFEFSTEQFGVNLSVNILDTRTPQLMSTSISFNLENAENPNVEIGVISNSGILISVSMDGVVLQENLEYTYINNFIIFDADDLYAWEIGEYDIDFTFSYNSSVITLTFTLSIIDTTLPYSVESSRTYDKANPSDVEFHLVLNMENFETLQGELTENNWEYEDDKLTIYNDYLMSRPQGQQHFIVYTSGNAFAIRVDLISTANKCYNIHIDTDSSYPDMVLKWEYSGYQDIYYEIKNIHSDMVTGANSVVLTSVSKTDTFEYRVKAGAGDWSAWHAWAPGTGSETYFNKSYSFLGETYDYYMSSQEELNNFLYYACFDRNDIDYDSPKLPNSTIDNTHGFKVMDHIYIGFDYTGAFIGEDNSPVNIALREVPLSGITVSAPIGTPDNTARITIIYTREPNPSQITTGNDADQINHYPSHIEELKGSNIRSSSYEGFAINSLSKTQIVETTEQLFLATEAGIRPIPQTGSPAERIYNIAKDVLRDIITDDMNDYDKIHSIYDWLIHTVEYDRVMLNIYINPYHEYNDKFSPTYNSYYKYNCFYLEGVFDDHLAVCDGFAKAFVLLTRIEGIESIKVNGESKPLNQAGYVAHAWNKVKLNNNWYVVDSTWGNVITGVLYHNPAEYMTHAYLLVSDIDIYGTHIETKPTVVAHKDSSYYKNTEFASGKNLYIETQQEFNDMIDVLVKFGKTTYIDFFNATGIDNATLLASASLPLGIHSKGYVPINMNNGSAILVKYGPVI